MYVCGRLVSISYGNHACLHRNLVYVYLKIYLCVLNGPQTFYYTRVCFLGNVVCMGLPCFPGKVFIIKYLTSTPVFEVFYVYGRYSMRDVVFNENTYMFF